MDGRAGGHWHAYRARRQDDDGRRHWQHGQSALVSVLENTTFMLRAINAVPPVKRQFARRIGG
jgi:hypothetical protein